MWGLLNIEKTRCRFSFCVNCQLAIQTEEVLSKVCSHLYIYVFLMLRKILCKYNVRGHCFVFPYLGLLHCLSRYVTPLSQLLEHVDQVDHSDQWPCWGLGPSSPCFTHWPRRHHWREQKSIDIWERERCSRMGVQIETVKTRPVFILITSELTQSDCSIVHLYRFSYVACGMHFSLWGTLCSR